MIRIQTRLSGLGMRELLIACCFAVASGPNVVAAPSSAVDDEPTEEGFVALFDGESLDGWDGNPDLWDVVDGVIVGKTSEAAPLEQNEFLIWDGRVADFVLRLEFRVADRGAGNSGVQYRAKRFPNAGRWVLGGYQADIERTNRHMGILYEERGRGIIAPRGQEAVLSAASDPAKPGAKTYTKRVIGSVGSPADIVKGVKAGEWQDYEVIAVGRQLEHKLNGRTTVKVTDNDDAHAAFEGLLGLQLHRGLPMQIEFRNIRLREITNSTEALNE